MESNLRRSIGYKLLEDYYMYPGGGGYCVQILVYFERLGVSC